MELVHLPHGRLAIRDADVLLAVPPMHPLTTMADRARILDYVLRRQPGLAFEYAQMAREAADGRERYVQGLAKLLAQAPHHSRRAAA